MASPDNEPRKYSASEVVAFSDAELDKYLLERRQPNFGITVSVKDPGNLPEEFLERLR